MPIYEYQCESCGHRLEKIQKMSDDPIKDCPDCGKPDMRKLVSAAAFRLKGGGWYETDFKTGSKKNVLHGADSSSKSSDSSSSGDSGGSAGGAKESTKKDSGGSSSTASDSSSSTKKSSD